MDDLEKEVIRLKIQIKHNIKRLVENTKWNKTFERLVVSHGIFDVQSLENLKRYSNPTEQFYENILKQAYCYNPADIHTVLNTLSLAFKESDNSDAGNVLTLMMQKTACDQISSSDVYESCSMRSSGEYLSKFSMFPQLNDSIDWTILSKKIKWNKKLEKKLIQYQLLDSDILHQTGFPKDKVENLYHRIRKISYKQIPNKNFKQTYTRVVKILAESGNYKAASLLDLSETIREVSSIKKKPSGKLRTQTGACLTLNPNKGIELSMPLSPPRMPLESPNFRDSDRSSNFKPEGFSKLRHASDHDHVSETEESPISRKEFELVPKRPLRIDVKKATELRVPPTTPNCYPMTGHPRGSVLIINNERFTDISQLYATRHGSTIDANNLSILFRQLDFRCDIKEDRKYEDMLDDIHEFSKLKEEFDANMRILVILSHGDHSNVLSADGYKLPYEWIITQFNNYNCPHLRGKPKLFIFPACRGAESDFGVEDDYLSMTETSTDSLSPDASVVMKPSPMISRSGRRLPMYGDMLIAYGTVHGYVANRDTLYGSWYIECLCKVFMEKACEYELMEMLAEISREMLEYESEFHTVQTCSYEVRGCFNKLYFNPGL